MALRPKPLNTLYTYIYRKFGRARAWSKLARARYQYVLENIHRRKI